MATPLERLRSPWGFFRVWALYGRAGPTREHGALHGERLAPWILLLVAALFQPLDRALLLHSARWDAEACRDYLSVLFILLEVMEREALPSSRCIRRYIRYFVHQEKIPRYLAYQQLY